MHAPSSKSVIISCSYAGIVSSIAVFRIIGRRLVGWKDILLFVLKCAKDQLYYDFVLNGAVETG